MENNLVFPFWVGKIFISFEASRQPYTGSRGLVSWCAWLLQQIELQLQSNRNINPMRFLWNQKAHNTKIVLTFLSQHCHYKITIIMSSDFSGKKTCRQFGPHDKNGPHERNRTVSTVRTLPYSFISTCSLYVQSMKNINRLFWSGS